MKVSDIGPKMREMRVLHEMSRCAHFTGIHKRTCRAGVDYERAREGPQLACLVPAVTICASRELPTREQAEVLADQAEEQQRAFLAKVTMGICGTCEDESTDFRQIGKCIYSVPCGHRVGHGKAAEYKAGVLKARAGRTP